MKHIVLFIALTAITITGNAQSKNDRMTNASALTDEQQLQQLNASFIRNFINQDTVAHNEIIHKNFICIQSNGSIVDRDTYMKGWASGYSKGDFNSFTYTDESIRIFGNMALVRSRTVYSKQSGTHGSSVYTDVYIKENGRWWCVQAQITAIADRP